MLPVESAVQLPIAPIQPAQPSYREKILLPYHTIRFSRSYLPVYAGTLLPSRLSHKRAALFTNVGEGEFSEIEALFPPCYIGHNKTPRGLSEEEALGRATLTRGESHGPPVPGNGLLP